MRYVRKCGWVAALALGLALSGCASVTANNINTGPTPTPVLAQLPTATPIPTPADPTGQALLRTARSALGSSARSVEGTYDTSAQSLTVTVTIDGNVPLTDDQIAAAYARVKALVLQEMSGLWSSGLPLRQAMVIIQGPTKDEYNIIINQWYGIAVVKESTARHFAWASATPESAWKTYNQTYLREQFDLFDEIPPAPPLATATPTK
jgi:hypothetical protein